MQSIPQETLDIRQIRLSDSAMQTQGGWGGSGRPIPYLILETTDDRSIEIPIGDDLRQRLAVEIALARLPPRKEPRK